MRERISAFDWAGTPLGPMETWPQSLRSAVELTLGMPQPAFLIWGPDMTFLYNDTYAGILGTRHRDALGRPFADVWPERTNVFEAVIDRLVAGESQQFDAPGGEKGRTGSITTSCAPLRDESGRVVGCFGIGTEAAPQESQAALQSLFDTAPFLMGIGEIDGDRTIAVSANRMTAEYFGRRAESIPGHSSQDLGVPDDIEALWLDHLRRSLRDGTPVRFDYRDPQFPGSPWLRCTVSIIGTGTAGRPRYSFVVEDITGRKVREQHEAILSKVTRELVGQVAIAETMDRLAETIGRYFDVAHCLFGEIVDEQRASAASYGWDAEGTSPLRGTQRGRDFLTDTRWAADTAGELFIVNETSTDSRVSADRYAALGIRSFVVVPLASDRQWRFGLSLIDGKPRTWRDDEVALIQELGRRICARLERARVEAALRESEENFRSIANVGPDLLWFSESGGSTTWFNQRWLEYTGQTLEGAASRGWTDAIHPDDREQATLRYREAVGSAEPFQREYRLRRYDGEYRWFLVRAEPLTEDSGQVIRVYGAATDIHALRAVRDELEERVSERTAELTAAVEEVQRSEKQMRYLLDQMPAMLWTADREMRLTALVGSSVATWPAVRGTVDGLRVSDLFADTDVDGTAAAIHKQALEGMTAEFEFRVAGHTFEAHVEPLHDTRGQTDGAIGVAHDVTDRTLRKLQEDFIASVSHELQTPLTSIRAGLGLLDAAIGQSLAPAERELLSASRRNVERLRLRIRQLLAANQIAAGSQNLERSLIDLRDLVEHAVNAVRPLLREKHQTVDVDLPNRMEVEGDQHLLEQALANLLSNAHRHTPAGTRIAVSGWFVGDQVRLAVHDTGPGIPSDQIEAIFQRFYRVRGADREGIGLGLAITRDAVQAQGGRVWAESIPGQGSTFFVSLPRAQQAEPA